MAPPKLLKGSEDTIIGENIRLLVRSGVPEAEAIKQAIELAKNPVDMHKVQDHLHDTPNAMGYKFADFDAEDNDLDRPKVEHPTIFQPDPPMPITDPYYAKLAGKMLDLDPEAKSRVSRVTAGPSKTSMENELDPNNPERSGDPGFTGYGLLGQYGNDKGIFQRGEHDIVIAPALATPPPGGRDADRFAATMGHELTHAALGNEKRAYALSDPLEKESDDKVDRMHERGPSNQKLDQIIEAALASHHMRKK